MIVSGSFDESLRVWDVRTGRQLRVMPGHSDPVTAVAFTNNDTIVSASYDGHVRLWAADTGKCITTIGLQEMAPPVTHVFVSPNSRFVLVSTSDSMCVCARLAHC